jgi:Protein of unknown function (DUF3618)
MDQETRELRQQVEDAREHLGATIEELAYRANVPARVRRRLGDRIRSARQAFQDPRTRRVAVAVAIGAAGLTAVAIAGTIRRG